MEERFRTRSRNARARVFLPRDARPSLARAGESLPPSVFKIPTQPPPTPAYNIHHSDFVLQLEPLEATHGRRLAFFARRSEKTNAIKKPIASIHPPVLSPPSATMPNKGRKAKTPNSATPGFVGPTPLSGSSRRDPSRGGTSRGSRQQDIAAFGSEHPEAARKLKPVGFFGTAMPRTTIMDKVEKDGQTVAVVEAPADDALAPVSIADIDQGANERKEHCFFLFFPLLAVG